MSRPQSLSPAFTAVGAVALAMLLALAVSARVEAAAASPAPILHDLATLAELGVAFDEGAGAPRLVLLLSPT